MSSGNKKGGNIAMAKRPSSDANASKYLLFVDTNVWLDFYRMEGSEGTAKSLDLIEKARPRLICTDQVQMEFMKHRQKTILDLLARLKAPEPVALPPIIADKKAAQAMKAQKEAMDERRKKLRSHVEQILINPGKHDPVYRTLQSMYVSPTDLVLCRPKDERYTIRGLAEKRWKLGYPPRKDSDTSIGDAINWEWIIDCANRHGGHVIIVSRDQDYGRAYLESVYLNDWLHQEYKARVKGRCRVILTNRLGAAFRRMAVTVPKQVITAEGKLLSAPAALIASTATDYNPSTPQVSDLL
jgi:predicted nucleic acid-binding protein